MTCSTEQGAAHIPSMSTSTLTRVSAGVPTGGQFAATNRAESEAFLIPDAVISGLTTEQSKAVVEAHAAIMDVEHEAAEAAGSTREHLFHDGKVRAHAEVLAYVLTPDDGRRFVRYDQTCNDLVDDRYKSGHRLELDDSFTGPGELSVDRRNRAIEYLRGRADRAFMAADQPDPGASAWAYGQAEVFNDAADELAGDATQFTGGEL